MDAQVLIAGVGMVPFRRPGKSDPYDVMAEGAVRAALADARLDYDLVDQAFAGFVLADSCSGQRALYRVGMGGIPITNVSNNCASGSTALYLARQAVLAGEAECALAVGFEEMRPGALDRVFPQLADPLERHRDCVGAAMGFGDAERAMPAICTWPHLPDSRSWAVKSGITLRDCSAAPSSGSITRMLPGSTSLPGFSIARAKRVRATRSLRRRRRSC